MRISYDRGLWDVYLIDDGTLDTVISVQPVRGDHPAQQVRFDGEYASEYRYRDGELTIKGLRELGIEAAEAYKFDNDED